MNKIKAAPGISGDAFYAFLEANHFPEILPTVPVDWSAERRLQRERLLRVKAQRYEQEVVVAALISAKCAEIRQIEPYAVRLESVRSEQKSTFTSNFNYKSLFKSTDCPKAKKGDC
ncbi:hypothetical protein [Sporosarcina koreensis]|uniref:Transposase n=1 Tax=Sporosarcina koreensis TaxID=334735 RepID=A0ABW0TUA3_9BACL